jgi:hypothetical protein
MLQAIFDMAPSCLDASVILARLLVFDLVATWQVLVPLVDASAGGKGAHLKLDSAAQVAAFVALAACCSKQEFAPRDYGTHGVTE